MGISRRGALGVAAGGAVAAVGAKRSSDTAAFNAKTPTAYSGGAEKAYPVEDKEWTARQVAEARRIAAGDFEDIRGEKISHCPYSCLHSVSEAAKTLMRERRSTRVWREHRIKRAVEALKQYDATGVINTLF